MVPNRSDTKQAVQSQKQAGSLKFRTLEEENVYYPCGENKGADQVTAKLICVFVFAYAECWFSHEAADILGKVFHDYGVKTFCRQNVKDKELTGCQNVLFLFLNTQ